MGLKTAAESTWKMAVNTMDFQSWDSVSKDAIKAILISFPCHKKIFIL